MEDVEVSYPSKGVTVVELRGEHDVLTSIELAELLREVASACELLVVDASAALFVDSSFLHLLEATADSAEERGSRLVVRVGERSVARRALEASGLHLVLHIASTRDQAIAA